MSEQNHSLYSNSEFPPRERPSHREETPRRRRSRKSRKGHSGLRRVLKVLGTLALIGITTGALLCCFGAVYIKTVILPEAGLDLEEFFLGENSVMYYYDEDTGNYEELTTLATASSSIWVDEEIPDNLRKAAVAIEDQRFYTHNGVDWKRTAGAVFYMFTGQDIQGGSTITQQLIKNLTGEDQVTVKRKITEIFRALDVDSKYDKDVILTWYLNVIYLGQNYKGVGSASYGYFGKPVNELTLAECASLIAITNNPSMYSPYSDAVFTNEETGEKKTAVDLNKQRQELILSQMLKQGMISQEEHDEAVAQELVFARGENTPVDTEIYSWYEETVISDVRRDLKAEYGYTDDALDLLLSSGGLKIYTCVDPDIQAKVEAVYENRENLNYTSPSGKQQMQSAITVLDNETGNVVAIAGRVGEKTGNRWKNFATDTYRQPGSSIKPLSVYAPAIEMGKISPISVVDDYPYQLMGGSPWPTNSGAASYKGLTTIQQAVAQSVNTIAVRVLADYVTKEASFDFMESRFHIDLVDAREENGKILSDMDISPLALGGLTDGVNTRDMAEGYATFPNGGVYRESRTYTKVLNSRDEILLNNEVEEEQVLKDTTAYYMNEMLKGVVTGGTGTQVKLSGMTAAGKTGTTSENYDRWFVGYTPHYTAAVWTGYEYNEKMRTSGNPAAAMWKLVMQDIHEGLEDKGFDRPSGLVEVKCCKDSGLRASDYCQMDPRGGRVATAYVFQEDAPTEYCTVHTQETTESVWYCKDSPILDGEGNETGLYHIAGEYCPEESKIQMALPNYVREPVGGATAQDEKYLYTTVQAAGTCTVHTTPPEPEVPVEPENPDVPNYPWFPWYPGGTEEPEQPGEGGSTGGAEGTGGGGSGAGSGTGTQPGSGSGQPDPGEGGNTAHPTAP